MIFIAIGMILYARMNTDKSGNTDIIAQPNKQYTLKWSLSVAIFGCLGNYLAIAGLESVYLAIASLLNNTFPIFVIVVAYFMLHETLIKPQIIAIGSAFFGMILMSLNSLTSIQPKDPNANFLASQSTGFVLIVLSELAGAISFTSSKKLPASTNLFHLALYKISLIYLVSIMYLSFSQGSSSLTSYFQDIETIVLFVCIALGDLTVNLLIFKTFQLEKAGLGASMNFLCIVWSLILDITVFGQRFKSWTEIVGGLIVMASTSAIIFVK